MPVDKPPEPLVANIDPERVGQVLFNLVGNALKFTPQHGRIRVQVAHEPGRLICRIQDSDDGIHADDLPRLIRYLGNTALSRGNKTVRCF